MRFIVAVNVPGNGFGQHGCRQWCAALYFFPVAVCIKLDLNASRKDNLVFYFKHSLILKVLTDNNYDVVQYDLYFHDNKELLEQQYDYIACSETAEHFKDPYTEFKQLFNLLKPNGKLYIMTDRFEESRDFGTWFYKTDPTHVFLYHAGAFEWIRDEFGFSQMEIDNRLVILSR